MYETLYLCVYINACTYKSTIYTHTNIHTYTHTQVVDAEEGADEKAITAMGLLSTIETLINCMEENPKIMEQIEPITLQVVGLILTKNVMGK